MIVCVCTQVLLLLFWTAIECHNRSTTNQSQDQNENTPMDATAQHTAINNTNTYCNNLSARVFPSLVTCLFHLFVYRAVILSIYLSLCLLSYNNNIACNKLYIYKLHNCEI